MRGQHVAAVEVDLASHCFDPDVYGPLNENTDFTRHVCYMLLVPEADHWESEAVFTMQVSPLFVRRNCEINYLLAQTGYILRRGGYYSLSHHTNGLVPSRRVVRLTRGKLVTGAIAFSMPHWWMANRKRVQRHGENCR